MSAERIQTIRRGWESRWVTRLLQRRGLILGIMLALQALLVAALAGLLWFTRILDRFPVQVEARGSVSDTSHSLDPSSLVFYIEIPDDDRDKVAVRARATLLDSDLAIPVELVAVEAEHPLTVVAILDAARLRGSPTSRGGDPFWRRIGQLLTAGEATTFTLEIRTRRLLPLLFLAK